MKKLLLSSLLISAAVSLSAATTISPINHFAYGANVGWIDGRGGDRSGGAVIGQYVCSGYLYSANVGWINLGSGTPANGIRYSNLSARDFGVNYDGLGNLEGTAWGANIGWLMFTNRTERGATYDGPKVDPFTGQMSGYVWSANAGWISLGNAVAFVQTDSLDPGADTDQDGIPDAWELEHFGNLTTANATSDYDGDGFSDLQAYRAGTDPKDAGSSPRLLSIAAYPDGSAVTIVWRSQPTRQYRIWRADGLTLPLSWLDLGLGLIQPASGTSTSQLVRNSGSRQGFYRIEAMQPLVP